MGTDPVNWLARLDEFAATQPGASDWLEYSYFIFARYPNLEPAPISEPKSQRIHFESGQTVFELEIWEWEERIATHEKASRTLEKLIPEQRRQLAALIIDCIADFEWYELYVNRRDRISSLAREADRRIRQLRRKLMKIRNALQGAIKYGGGLDPLFGSEFTSATEDHGKEFLTEDKSSLIHYLQPSRFWQQALDNLPKFHPVRENPATSAMVQVFWFFKNGCGLSSHESEVRVALIRNTFWTAWTRPVKYLPYYDSVESQGCTAVRKAVSRFSPDQGTTS